MNHKITFVSLLSLFSLFSLDACQRQVESRTFIYIVRVIKADPTLAHVLRVTYPIVFTEKKYLHLKHKLN